MIRRRRRRKKQRGWLVVLTVLMVLTLLGVSAVAAKQALIWHENEYTLEMKLRGGEELSVPYGEPFEDPGVTCRFWGTHLLQEVQEVPVTVEGTVDTATVGAYELRYSAHHEYKDVFWDQRQTRYSKRTVYVVDGESPVIRLNHIEGHYTLPGQAYVEEGYTAYDEYDGDLTDQVVVTSDGETVTYKVTDSSGNSFIATRTIFYDDPIVPEITLLGESQIAITEGDAFTDPGCTASDNVDGDITANIVVSGTVDNQVPGTYTLTYTVSDAWGNTVSTQRTVVVKVRPTPPPTQPPTEPPKPKPKPNPKPPVITVELPQAPAFNEPQPSGSKVIYLTFDDGPGQHTSRLLDILGKYGVKATFFVRHSGYMSVLSRMVQEGHTVAMHCYTHTYSKVYADDNAYLSDLKKIQNEIRNYTGQTSYMVRFPGGSSNTVSRNYCYGIMTRMTQKLDELGYRYFDWNVDSKDAGGAKTAAQVYRNVVNGISKSSRRSIVVLQHDIKGFSVDAVEDIIQWGLANGYTFAALNMNSPVCELKVAN